MTPMGPSAFSSNEELPEGKTRCPKCQAVHDIGSSRIADRRSISKEEEIGRKALAQFYESHGMRLEVVHVKCPHCGTTYEITQGK